MDDTEVMDAPQASALTLKEAILTELHQRVTHGEKDAEGLVKPAGAATIKVALDYLKMFAADLENQSPRAAQQKSDKLDQLASTLPFPGQRKKA